MYTLSHAHKCKLDEPVNLYLIWHQLLQALNAQQLYQICTQYWDDKYNTQSVSPDVSRDTFK
jgi:hypothetical protein